MPQLKTTEREALDAELKGDDSAKGLIVYDTDLDCLEFWNGEGWISLCVDKLVDCSTVTYPELNDSYDFVSGATIGDLITTIGGNVKLYDAPIDGNLYDDPSTLLVAGRTYYAEQRVSNCTNPDRVPVAVTISTSPVSGSATIDACVTVMYDFQYQTLTAYGTGGGAPTQGQWYAKRRGENDGEYKLIPGATAVSYKIPANFVKNVFRTIKSESGTDYNDSVVFQVKVSNAFKTVILSDTLDMEFIDTYGNDYVALKAPPSITGNSDTGGVIKVAYLNLGVEPDADGYNACDFGSLYQWGRITDGHEKINWTKDINRNIAFNAATQNNQASALVLSSSDYDQTTTVPVLAGAGALPFYQVTNADYKDKFLYNNSSYYGWNTVNTSYLYFWATSSYAKTSNDPCPSGWHVPTRFELAAIFRGTPLSGNPSTATDLNNTWTWRPNTDNRIAGGYIVTYNDGSDKSKRIFMPAAGGRANSDGSLDPDGGYGHYWSSTYSTMAYAYTMYFYSDYVSGGTYNYYKAYGFSVRCIAE